MACPNSWYSPFQVGSHHLARGFVRAGYQVAYISDPISPWHLARGLTADLAERFAIYQAGGRFDLNDRLWTYVPLALVTPHGKPLLRSGLVHRHWWRCTWPGVVRKARCQGFGRVDLLYLDSVYQAFWLDAIDYRQAVYRVADYNPQYEKYTPATRKLEEVVAKRVDLVLYPSLPLKAYAEGLGPRRCLYLPNGVDYEHFAQGPLAEPAEYRSLRRPIAVYLGVIPDWFHFEWLRVAARELPEFSFVLIGPDQLARKELNGLANVCMLGHRPYHAVPAYLQHADVGMMPFNRNQNPGAVEVLNPQKLYAYLASGLPVVSAEWEAIEDLETPARLCRTADEFVAALRQAVSDPGDRDRFRRYASRFAWTTRVKALQTMLANLRVRAA
jgi:glycosyltransferase involved in cell wall biosynthesis